MSSASDPARDSRHGDYGDDGSRRKGEGGDKGKDKGKGEDKGKASAGNGDFAEALRNLRAARDNPPETSGLPELPFEENRAIGASGTTSYDANKGKGVAQSVESEVDSGLNASAEEQEQNEKIRRYLSSNEQNHEAHSMNIQSLVAEGPIHGPDDFDNWDDPEFGQPADPEQEEHEGEYDEDDEGRGDNGVPPTQPGSSKDPHPKAKGKKSSKNLSNPERPHRCPEPHCAKGINGFQRHDHLVRHMFDHYSAPYDCTAPACDYSTRRKDKIKEHLLRVHKLSGKQAKTESDRSAIAARLQVSQITADIKQRLASQAVSTGTQVADADEEETGTFDELGDVLHDPENVGEDGLQNPPNASFDQVSSDDGEDSDDVFFKEPLKNKRSRGDSDGGRAGRKKVNMG